VAVNDEGRAAGDGVQVAGNVRIERGDFIGRDQVVRGNIYRAEHDMVVVSDAPIDWDAVDLGPQLRRTRELLAEHLYRFAGAPSRQLAPDRYRPLRVQEEASRPVGEGTSESRVGHWHELVSGAEPPAAILLSGPAGSGKTTQLLHYAQVLAETALERAKAPIPVYVSARTLTEPGSQRLLEHAAASNGLEPNVLRAAWRGTRHRLCLLIDGIDETPTPLSETIETLWSAAPENQHALVVSSRSGAVQRELAQTRVPWYRLALVTLSDQEIVELLSAYDVARLGASLEPRLFQLLQNPTCCPRSPNPPATARRCCRAMPARSTSNWLTCICVARGPGRMTISACSGRCWPMWHTRSSRRTAPSWPAMTECSMNWRCSSTSFVSATNIAAG